ncbi:DNA recombination protein [Solemya velesiana gill symbiont]|uniref:DNA recombination protein n=2 Tax=Solemya velesiana gill symbiont TaxID=1918948 RepID=A0A1T2KXQ0_9GAMM|nr:DNA recombination protein [Solemya velesiana gill symbiont]
MLALLALVLLAAGGLWLRQSRIIRLLEMEREGEAAARDRIEGLLREQERLLLHEFAVAREQRKEGTHELQRKLLLQISKLYQALERRFGEMQKHLSDDAGSLKADLISRFDGLHNGLGQSLGESRVAQQEALGKGFEGIARQLAEGLTLNAEAVGKRMDGLTERTDQRLQEISGQVDRRLSEGFEKTTETFSRVLEHLGRIDEAQKRITELSSNVVSLQEVLADKRSRGAFGEVQLNALIRNLMPEQGFSLQHTLSNGMRADCMLFLPEPTGNVAIDAKFPLESYQRLTDTQLPDTERVRAGSQFRQDIRKHINDIAGKYIIPGETSDGAVMFIPSESIFAEIHGHYPELVEEAHQGRVWLVSPTTMMAILTTARAVLKDAATREQVHVIQQHLNLLSKDFGRFQDRMDRLSRHIKQAHKDVEDVNVSARKISDRFGQIEKVELEELPGLEVGTKE